jgi:RHS repeat-associated protein
MVKYYYAGAMRVAMRTGEADPLWLLGDHLGSTGVVANYDGTIYSGQGYYAWGEKRYSIGVSPLPTTFRFTGQREAESLGLYFYGARWYDGTLGRFIQADTIIPNGYNSQAFDRYAYVLNNPLRFTDPSGYKPCDGRDAGMPGGKCTPEDDPFTKDELKDALKYEYRWEASEKLTLRELYVIYETGAKILEYLDKKTGGNGSQWMGKYLSGIYIEHLGPISNYTYSSITLGSTIYLNDNWLKGAWNPATLLAHELGHVWDNRSGWNSSIFGGGISDELAAAVGGNPQGFRYLNGTTYSKYCSRGFSCTRGIPEGNLWPETNPHGAYGNKSTADYFAETFTWSVFDPDLVPKGAAEWWLWNFPK